MIAVRIPGATRALGKAQGYTTLHVRDFELPMTDGSKQNAMMSAWEPTPDEIAAINAGAPIILTIIGTGHPPVMLSVGEKKDD